MKIFICDDKQEELDNLKTLIVGYRGIKSSDVEEFNPEKAYELIENKTFEFDIAILDIEYDELNFSGIDLGKKINKNCPGCQIIYLTHLLEYATDVYETDHVYFVLKKNMQKTIFRALDKVIDLYIENNGKTYFEVVSKGKKIMILQSDLILLERQQRLVNVYTTDSNFTTYESLKKCIEGLSNEFARCHGGYVLNMNFVQKIESDKIKLKNEMIIPIGRSYKNRFIRKYMDFISMRI